MNRQSSLPPSLVPYLFHAPVYRDSTLSPDSWPVLLPSTNHRPSLPCSSPSSLPSFAILSGEASPSHPYYGPSSQNRHDTTQHWRQANTFEPEPSCSSQIDIASNDNHNRRRAESMDTDDNQKKNSRKTAVACNFCRGRKLRCNGAKPSCYNCTVRKFDCEYVAIQRRRGPGKAPKGSRSRKARSEHPGSNSRNIGDPLSTTVPDYELSPDLRPYTSVISLDTFGFHPPDRSPLYPLDSLTRISRSREHSLEDIHRNQSGS